ncbi:ras and EF-hand domain-containing protein-like [Amphibalanus amphitrite]|nr:ras and EF-hand domain-containing protein-like [Amphibalanus amphitrite]
MLLYDVTSERSFLSVRQWVQSIDEVTDTRVPIMLCGNKVDMREALMKQGQTCITREQGETLARDFGAHFQETSARTGQGMVEAIVELGRRMLTNEDVEVQTSALKVSDDAKKGGACSGSSNSSSSCKK